MEALDNCDSTPLHLAAQEGHFVIVDLLVKAGASIEAEDSRRRIPLQLAAHKRHFEIAQLLSGVHVKRRKKE